jgi:hypothetical protein
VIRRRELCAEKLLDQKKLIEDPDYVRVTQRYSGRGEQIKSRELDAMITPAKAKPATAPVDVKKSGKGGNKRPGCLTLQLL